MSYFKKLQNCFNRISRAGFDKDFEIRIGGHSIYCSRFVASLISQKVSNLLSIDPTASKITLNFFHKYSKEEKELFISSFEQFLNGNLDTPTFFLDESENSKLNDKTSNKFNNDSKTDSIQQNSPSTEDGNIKNEKDYENDDEEILSEMQSSILNDKEKIFYIELGKILDNHDFLEECFQDVEENKNISIENVFKRIRMNKAYDRPNIIEFSFLSANFYQIDEIIRQNENMYYELDLNDYEQIFSLEYLKISNEDSLFNFIVKLISKRGEIYKSLLDFVEVQNLSNDSIEKLIVFIEDDMVKTSLLHPKLYSSIFCRLLQNNNQRISSTPSTNSYIGSYGGKGSFNPNNNVRNTPSKVDNNFSNYNLTHTNSAPGHISPMSTLTNNVFLSDRYQQSKPFNIISYLTAASGGNIYENDTISVKVSSIHDGQISNLFDESTHTHFRTNKSTNSSIEQSIIIDFKNYRVKFDKYSLSVPSSKNGQSVGRPESWAIEVSNDNTNWIEVARETESDLLNSYGAREIFDCSTKMDKYYRYVKFHSLDEYSFLLLSSIELVGYITKKILYME
ncbi:hypothetical protein TRFO_42978 [Tritrichomonas foetus]|uniref:F5/8 type C domain-containing protein n=1 Tax=Tritrichomonas foetus TaxID=1144522 RepID=A0A1J4KTG8_9EUKA|nr:hypothetical protein TRFO_42978 [Tritrichomonas foetus]|eukprot:OHT14559.1 hypothetical protein TRFO_42978 [Tritrichomonas foetus]